jgi:hypothetical protein
MAIGLQGRSVSQHGVVDGGRNNRPLDYQLWVFRHIFSSDFRNVGLPVPDEWLLVIAGYLAFKEVLGLFPTLIIAAIGTVSGVDGQLRPRPKFRRVPHSQAWPLGFHSTRPRCCEPGNGYKRDDGCC